MKTKNTFELWCRANAKEITLNEFEKEVGENFDEFTKKNKKYCLTTWQMFISRKNPHKIKVQKVKKIPKYILWKEAKLEARLQKIKDLKKEMLDV